MVVRALVACTLAACGFNPSTATDSDAPATSDAEPTIAGDAARQGSDAGMPGAPVVGSLVVTRALVTGAIDLTSEGTADWAVWGATAMTDFDHKATGGTQIASWTKVGTGTVYGYGNGYNDAGNDGFTWSDGTPTAVESTAQYCGVWIDDAPNGFSTTAPASTATRTLHVYVGGADATGTFTAQLSDGSVADYVDADGLGSPTTSWAGAYQVVYNSATDGATLHVSWVQSSTGGGDVNWSAASLR